MIILFLFLNLNAISCCITIQVCRSSLLSGQNVCWPRRMLNPGELRRVFRRDTQTDRRTDARSLHNALRLTWPHEQYGRFYAAHVTQTLNIRIGNIEGLMSPEEKLCRGYFASNYELHHVSINRAPRSQYGVSLIQ